MNNNKNVTENDDVLDLDTAAIAYTYMSSKKWAQTFRISAVLKEKVDPVILKQALRKMRKRFPSFFVRLSDGFIWKRFKYVSADNISVKEDLEFCSPVDAYDKKAPAFKIHYFDRRLSLDIFHGVTDGNGAMVFFKTLLAAYFNLQGKNIPATNGVLDINEEPRAEEFENSYVKNYDKSKGKLTRTEPAAHQFRHRDKESHFSIMQAVLPADELKKLTKSYGVSVTEFFAALYIYSFCLNIDKKDFKKPIKVQVPIDLRAYFNSQTLRNFSLYTTVTVPSKKADYTFEEILSEAVKQIAQGKKKDTVQKMLNVNVSDAIMPVTKYSPSFIKQPFIVAGVKLFGERMLTSPISNLGIVKVPDEMTNLIDYFDFSIGATKLNSIYASIVTFNGKVCVTFSTKKNIRNVQKSFFGFLKDNGVSINFTI